MHSSVSKESSKWRFFLHLWFALKFVTRLTQIFDLDRSLFLQSSLDWRSNDSIVHSWCLNVQHMFCNESVVFGLLFWEGQSAVRVYRAGQSPKWFVVAVMNEFANWFSVGSVDFHWEMCLCTSSRNLSQAVKVRWQFPHAAPNGRYRHRSARLQLLPSSVRQR